MFKEARASSIKNVLLLQPNGLIKRMYRKAEWNLPRTEKSIYLTFDDGPVPGLTEWVLNELKSRNALATFFCVGDNIRRHPAIFARITSEGHKVANHTMSHLKGFKSSVPAYLREVEECAVLVGNKMFRPPYGQLKRGQYRALVQRGYRIVLWDVISYDYENINAKRCAENVLKHTKNGSIVLFHDNIKAERNLKYALPLLLDHFLARGFEFKTL
jgi:peptidoglycan-N-acetylglucosamine deacetylase